MTIGLEESGVRRRDDCTEALRVGGWWGSPTALKRTCTPLLVSFLLIAPYEHDEGIRERTEAE